MKKPYISVFKVDKHKEASEVKVKSFEEFDKISHNSDNNFYYFNYNHVFNLWEHDYCQQMTDHVKKAFIKAKKKKLLIDFGMLYANELTLISKLEKELNEVCIINEKQRAKERYERSVAKLKESFPARFKESGKFSSIRA